MSFTAITQHMAEIEDDMHEKGIVLGCVVNSGCNMKDIAGRYCSYCAITQRDERDKADLLDGEAFKKAVYGATQVPGYPLLGVTVCGDEPTISPDVFYGRTLPILKTANDLGIRRGIVTNGLTLLDYAQDLIEAEADVSVSLDGVGGDNDLYRGGYATVSTNLRQLPSDMINRLTIASVIVPGKEHHLEPLLDVIAERGIKKWILSCLVRFNSGTFARIPRETVDYLDRLASRAKRYGVELQLDYHGVQPLSVDSLCVVRKPSDVFLLRLTYHGECTLDRGVFKTDGIMRKWSPHRDFTEFASGLIYSEHTNRKTVHHGNIFFTKKPALVEMAN